MSLLLRASIFIAGQDVQGCTDLGQLEPQMSVALPGLPDAMRRDSLLAHEPIQRRARDAKLPHDLRCSNHRFFVPHAPSVAAVLIVPLVPDHGRMVQLGHLGLTRQGAHDD